MPLVFRVANTGSASVTLQLLGRTPTADFRVSNARDKIIWTRLRGATMLGALRLYPLGAGEELVFREMWNARDDNGSPLPPGDYTIVGVLLTDDPKGMPSSPVRVRVEP